MSGFTFRKTAAIAIGFLLLTFGAQASEINLFRINNANTPIIDGVADAPWDTLAWNGLSSIVDGAREGIEDFDAVYKAAYSDDAIYLLIKVTDDFILNEPTPQFFFDNDCVNIFFGFGNEGGSTIDENDFQFSTVYGHSDLYSREGLSTEDIERAWKALEGGYLLEMAIPYSAINQLPLQAGQRIGFDLLINDFDNEGYRECVLAWSGDESDYSSSAQLGEWSIREAAGYTIYEAEEAYSEEMRDASLRGERYLETQTINESKVIFDLGYLEGGAYYVWIKARGDDTQSGEFSLAFDNDNDRTEALALSFQPSGMFQWVSSDATRLYIEQAGYHKFTIFSSCRFVGIDKIIVANDPTFIPTTLYPPRIHTVDVDGGQILISWDTVDAEANGIVLERKHAAEAEFTEIAQLENSVSSYIDNTTIPEDGLEYRLKVTNEYDSSPYSTVEKLRYLLPGAPQNVTTQTEHGREKLHWDPSEGDVTGYSVELRLNNSEYMEIKRVKYGRTEYRHDESYFLRYCNLSYRVRAYNSYGFSPYAYPENGGELITGLQYSNKNTDIYLCHDFCSWRPSYYHYIPGWHWMRVFPAYEGAIYQDLTKGRVENTFQSIPKYLQGTEYLRAFSKDAGLDDSTYLTFTALKNLRMYIAVEHDGNVDLDVWELVESSVSVNQLKYPKGVDIYRRSVRKDTVVELEANRYLSFQGNQYLLFLEEDPCADIRINFGPSWTWPIDGYRLDSGEVFGDNGDGLSYGWRKNASAYAEDRDMFWNNLTDTFIEITKDNGWEIQLPDGTYEVSVSLGDDWSSGTEELRINDTVYKFSEDMWHVRGFPNHMTVQTDVVISAQCGNRLTLERDKYTAKLNYIHIQRLANHLRTYAPTADTYIDSGDTWRINGGLEYIHVAEQDKHWNSEKIGLFAFEIPNYTNPIQASLELYVCQLDHEYYFGDKLQLYAVDGYSFDELSLNWKNCDLVSVKHWWKEVYLSEEVEYLGDIETDGSARTYRFDITDFLARRTAQEITFLVVGPEHGRMSAVLYSKEKGVNIPKIRVLSEKQSIELEGYCFSPSSGTYMLQGRDYQEYELISPYIDLEEFVEANVTLRGYIDPDYEVDGGLYTRIVVETIEVIPPPDSPVITVNPWDNTGYPVWRWTKPAGATLYRYRLDGSQWLETENTSFSPEYQLMEGPHTFELECKNPYSQWSSTVHATVTVDVTPPAITEMKFIDPTNNQHPPFDWKASDNFTESEQLLYQYRVDNAPWILSLSEHYAPSQTLPEGFRLFQIKIRDLAGNWSEVNLYTIEIDITPPEEATEFRMFYNDEGARLLWEESVSPDLHHYLITREPELPKTVVVYPGVLEYLDIGTPMIQDQVYTYTIRSVDKATNISAGVEISDGISQTVVPDEEVQIVDGTDVKAFFAPGTIDEPITVIIKKTDSPISSKPGVQQIGPVYHFEPHGIEFKAPVMLYFTYTDDQIANIEEENDLKVAYFDQVKLSWVDIPCVVDADENLVVAFTNHFSEYSLRIDTSNAYEGEGINPFGEYFTNLNEAVSETTGDLNVVMNLAELAGIASNNLSFNLIYSSSAAVREGESVISRTQGKISKDLSTYYNEHSMKLSETDISEIVNQNEVSSTNFKFFDLNHGWSLDIPHIVNSTVYLPGGSGYALNLDQEVHSGIHFSSKREGDSIVLTTASGYTYTFDGTSYFAQTKSDIGKGSWVEEYYKKLKDFNINNGISSYELQKAYERAFNSRSYLNKEWDILVTDRIARLSSMRDSFGNTITYSYSMGNITISSVSGSIVYSFDLLTPNERKIYANGELLATINLENGTVKNIQQHKGDGTSHKTSFIYDQVTLPYKISYYDAKCEKKDKERVTTVNVLSKISYPSSAYTDYMGLLSTEENRHLYRYNSQTVNDKDGNPEKLVEYSYEGGFRQIVRSATTIKDPGNDNSIEKETIKYYNTTGNMYRELSDAKTTVYEYYYEPSNSDRAYIKFEATGMTMGKNLSYAVEPNIYTTPNSGIAFTDHSYSLGETTYKGLKLDLDGDLDLYFVRNTMGDLIVLHGTTDSFDNVILTISSEDIQSPDSGYVWKDPVNTLLEYKGNPIYLILNGDNNFEVVYSKLSQTERVKRNRIKTKTVTDGALVYTEHFDYDGWGNSTYIQKADGHQVFKSYHPVYMDKQTENLESRNIAVYTNRSSLMAAGNYNRTTWEYSNIPAPNSMTIYDGIGKRVTSYKYYNNGTLSKITEPSGAITNFFYDNSKGLLSKKEIKGVPGPAENELPYSEDVVSSYTYDNLNRLETETLGGERTTRYAYDRLGRLTEIRYPDGSRKIQYYQDDANTTIIANIGAGDSYTSSGLTSEGLESTSELINKVKYIYNGLNNLTRLSKYQKGMNQAYFTADFTYNTLGQMVGSVENGALEDDVKRMSSRDYDLRGRLTSIVREDKSTVNIVYLNSQLVTEYTDEEGYSIKTKNDLAGRLTQRWIQGDSDSANLFFGTKYEYDGIGSKTKIINGLLFDNQGNILEGSSIPGSSEEFIYAYNGYSELINTINPSRKVIHPTDGSDLGIHSIQTDMHVVLENGLTITKVKNPNEIILGTGKETISQSDSQGRVLKTISTLGYETLNGYDKFGQLVETADPEGHRKYYSYNSKGLVEYERDGDNRYTHYEYDALGNVTKKSYGTYDPQTTTYTESYWETFVYDSLSRMTHQYFPDGTFVENKYDRYGNVKEQYDRGNAEEQYDRDNRKTKYEYDKRDRVTLITSPAGIKTTYAYNKRGEKTSETVGNSNPASYDYNGLGQLVKYDNPAGSRLTFTYDRVGRKVSRTEGIPGQENKNSAEYEYLPGTELVTQTTISGGGASLVPQVLAYDANGNLCIDTRNSVVRYYQYDSDNRLVTELDSADSAKAITYDYYDNGLLKERQERSGKTETRTYTKANLLETITNSLEGESQVRSFAYDFLGRIKNVTRNGVDSFTKSYKYEPSTGYLETETFTSPENSYSAGYAYKDGGEIDTIRYPGSVNKLAYGYNDYGQLTRVQGVTAETGFTYDGNLGLLESVNLEGGKKIGYAYDKALRLTQIGYGDDGLEDPLWSLENTINEYGNITDQTISGSVLQALFDKSDPRTIQYGYDYLHRLEGYSNNSVHRFTFEADPSSITSISRDFETDKNRNSDDFEQLQGLDPPMPGMDYYQSEGSSLIMYYPDIEESDDILTRTKYFALDSEGRSLILEMDTPLNGITALKLYPTHYGLKGEEVSRKNYTEVMDRFNDYNIVVKYKDSSGYTLIENKEVAAENNNLTANNWHFVKDTDQGILELRFKEALSAEAFKIYILIDERTPEFQANAEADPSGLIMNPTARENEDYFNSQGTFINSVKFIAGVEYELESTKTIIAYEYDDNGNRTRKVTTYQDIGKIVEQAYTYHPNSNRLKNDGTYNYEYDDDGNLRRRYNDYVDYRYNWNLENRLESVDLRQYRFGWNETWEGNLSPEDLGRFLRIFEAKYDESGRRYWKWAKQVDGTVKESRYAYTSFGLLYEETNSGGTTTKKSYIYGEGKKLAEVKGSLDMATATDGTVTGFDANIISYTVCDQLESTRLLVNQAGAVLWYAEYEPFGDTSYEESRAGGATTDQTFTSYTRDVEIGLHYAMARYYQSDMGRFITEDPAKDGANWYVYCGNNPLRYVDPSGLMVVSTGDGRYIETNKPEDRKDDEPIVKVYPPSTSDSSDSGSDGGDARNRPKVDVKSLFDKLLDSFLPNKDHITITDIQTGLDIAGWIPIIGDIADLGNAAIYAIQGDYANAGLSLICLIPVAGDAIGKSGKVIKAAIKNSDDLAAVVKLLVKNSDKLDELADGAKAARNGLKTGETSFTRLGRQAHKDYNPGVTYQKEFTLPSGKRVDAVDLDAGIVRELKPDNPRAILRGEKQVESYRQELQQLFPDLDWKAFVDTYKR